MPNTITTCLWFDVTAKDAAEFYGSIFKGSKITNDTPMVVTFELCGSKFMGLNGGPMFKINPSISLFVISPTVEETRVIWECLSEGGTTLMQLDKYPWSECYGWIQDKFGVTWQVMVANQPGELQKITPSFLFTGPAFGRAEEAIKLYTTIFKDSMTKVVLHYHPGDPNEGKVMYSEFQLNKTDFIAMDGPGEHHYTFNEGVSLMVSCDTQDEIDYYWNKLTDGGKESMCGWLVDKFGVSWQIVPSVIGSLMQDPARAKRVMAEVMKMKKLDLQKMLNA